MREYISIAISVVAITLNLIVFGLLRKIANAKNRDTKNLSYNVPTYLLVAVQNARQALQEGDAKACDKMLEFIIAEVQSGSYKLLK